MKKRVQLLCKTSVSAHGMMVIDMVGLLREEAADLGEVAAFRGELEEELEAVRAAICALGVREAELRGAYGAAVREMQEEFVEEVAKFASQVEAEWSVERHMLRQAAADVARGQTGA